MLAAIGPGMNNQALVVQPAPLATSNASHLVSRFRAYPGRIELTAPHLVFYQRSRLWLMFGALGMILSRLTAGRRAFDLELARVATIARGTFGLNKKILELTMADGTGHRFAVERYDELAAALRDQLARHKNLRPDGADRWQISA